jgi:hypothetical protein
MCWLLLGVIMQAIEFETVVKSGHIHVPEECGELNGQKIRVLVLLEEEPKEDLARKNRLIEKFIKHPLAVEGFMPLPRNDIYER